MTPAAAPAACSSSPRSSVEEHGGRLGDIAIYGQESNYTTWRLAKMNLAVRGIDADIRWNNEGSFHKDELQDLKFDFILANPPFNVSDWGGDRLREDARWKFGVPPVGNANYAWLQHVHHHLAPNTHGRCGVGQRLHVLGTVRGRRHSPRHGRGRRGRLHGRPCQRPTVLFSRRSQPAFGSSLGTRTPERVPAIGGERRCSSTHANSDTWSIAHAEEFSDEDIAHIEGAYHAWRGSVRRGDLRQTYRASAGEACYAGGNQGTPTTSSHRGAMSAWRPQMATTCPFEERFTELKEDLWTKQFAEAKKLERSDPFKKLEKIWTFNEINGRVYDPA